MKTLIATGLVLASTSVFAHDNSCDINLRGGVEITPQAITFYQHKKTLYTITAQNQLVIDHQTVALTAEQQTLVNQYQQKIRTVVPEIGKIAVEGVELAMNGVSIAFNKLLGDNNDVASDINTELADIKTKLEQKFASGGRIYLDEDGINGEELLGDDFDEVIEQKVEAAIKDSMGSLLIAVGQQMLSSGGDMDEFEAKMENFGDEIEQQIEAKANVLEHKADALCEQVVQIDALETQLQQQISQFPKQDLIRSKA